MDKEEILNYVENTPDNTNRAILSQMIDSLGETNKEFATVTITKSGDDYTADKTGKEIAELYNKGKFILGVLKNTDSPEMVALFEFQGNFTTTYGQVTFNANVEGQNHFWRFLFGETTMEVTTGTTVNLPAVDATDNGKILIVKNGEWTVDNLPSTDTMP